MDFTREGMVSVWVGTMSEPDFVVALSARDLADDEEPGDQPIAPFAAAFGIGWYDQDYLEACFEPMPMPIAELFAGVSFGSSFVPEVLRVAEQQGVATANVAVLLYDCCFAPTSADQSAFAFVGAFAYDEECE